VHIINDVAAHLDCLTGVAAQHTGNVKQNRLIILYFL
jgi:hypothetical protein